MLRHLALYLLCLEIIVATTCFGAVHIYAWGFLVFVSYLVLVIVSLDKFLTPSPGRIPRCLWLTLAIFVLSLSCQLWLPLTIRFAVPSRLHRAVKNLGVVLEFPAVIDYRLARLAFWQWLIAIVPLIAVPHVLRRRRQCYLLAGLIVAVATFQAGYGLWQFWAAADPMPFLNIPVKEQRLFKVSGAYINYNTYGCLMSMGVAIGLGLLFTLIRRRHQPDKRATLAQRLNYYWSTNPRRLWIALVAAGLMLMLTALLLSLSRGAILCCLIGMAAFLGLLWRQRLLYLPWQALVLVVILPALLYLCLIGIEPLLQKFSELPAAVPGRWQLWQATVNICRHHLWFGCGGGCYQYALAVYMPAHLAGRINPVIYAHNDYLHFLAEYGLIAAALGLFFCAFWLKTCWHYRRISPWPSGLWCGIWAALIAVALHGLIDYSLHVSSHRLLAAILLASLLAQRQTQDRGAIIS